MKKAILLLTVLCVSTVALAQFPKVKKPKIDLPKKSEEKVESPVQKQNKPAPVKDFGMTSAAHEKYVDTIVFSKNPILFQKETESEFASKFAFPDEKPYFMAYFPKSIANRCLEEHGVLPDIANAYLTVSFFINGEPAGSVDQAINQSQLNEWTGWSEPKTPLGWDKFTSTQYFHVYKDTVIPKIKKGENTIKMVMGYKVQSQGQLYTNIEPLTEGTLVHVSEANFAKEFEQAPEPVMRDAKLEKQIHDALAFRWQKTTVILKVILTEKEWRVETNALGVPVHQILRVYALTKPNPEKYSAEDASHCYATPYEVKREYAGNGKFNDEIKWHSSGGRPNYEVECPQ